MPKVSTKKKVSPGRVPHTGRRPKARDIGPDVLCAGPKPPRKPKKPRAKKPAAAPASGSAVRAMAVSLAAARLAAARRMLKEESDMFRAADISQTILFAGGMIFLFRGAAVLAASVLAIGTFAPMLIRRGIAKWRDRLMP